jgi:hypothetical protein
MAKEGALPDPFRLVGTTIEAKYRVVSVVGDGGFGVVYRGEHVGFGEPIAIKCLKLPATLREAEREGLLSQLKEEGRILHRLSKTSPGIVQALDVGAVITEGGVWVPYLVLEWLEGQTLADYLAAAAARGEGVLTPREAADLMEPAARALATAHAHKIAHRDVKPANLFLTESLGKRSMKVLDFGIAKVFTENATVKAALAATAESPSAFTPRYGAPEQFSKQRGATGPWTDVFALALLYVELVTGQRALDGDDPTQLYIAAADPSLRPTPRARGFASSDGLERVLARALHVEPQNRYPEAGAFWDDLERAVAEGVSGERPIAPRSERRAPRGHQRAHHRGVRHGRAPRRAARSERRDGAEHPADAHDAAGARRADGRSDGGDTGADARARRSAVVAEGDLQRVGCAPRGHGAGRGEAGEGLACRARRGARGGPRGGLGGGLLVAAAEHFGRGKAEQTQGLGQRVREGGAEPASHGERRAVALGERGPCDAERVRGAVGERPAHPGVAAAGHGAFRAERVSFRRGQRGRAPHEAVLFRSHGGQREGLRRVCDGA